MGSLTWWGSIESPPRWPWGFLLHFTRERGQNVILGIKLPQQCFWMKASKKFRCQKLPGGRLWKAQEFLLSVVLDMRGPRSPLSEQSVGEPVGSPGRCPQLKHPAPVVPLMVSIKSQDMHMHNIHHWPMTNLHGNTQWLLRNNKNYLGHKLLKSRILHPASILPQKTSAALLGHWDNLALQLTTINQSLFSSQARYLMAPHCCEIFLFSPASLKRALKTWRTKANSLRNTN